MIAAVLSACSTTTVQPLPSGPAGTWTLPQMIDALRSRRDQFQSLKAVARVNYSGGNSKQSFQEAVLVARPDRLRLETLSLLGAVFIVTADGQDVTAYDPRGGTYIHGRGTKASLAKFTQIPLEVDEITALLIGVPAVDPAAPAQQNGNAVIFASAPGRSDRVSFESDQPVPTRWERMNAQGEVELSAAFGNYIQTGAGPFPSLIVVDLPKNNRHVEIRYEQPELNSAIANDVFVQPKPANVKEYPIEALGR